MGKDGAVWYNNLGRLLPLSLTVTGFKPSRKIVCGRPEQGQA